MKNELETFVTYYDNGQKEVEVKYKGGTMFEGLCSFWYENGQEEREENYKDGELVKETTWKQSINR